MSYKKIEEADRVTGMKFLFMLIAFAVSSVSLRAQVELTGIVRDQKSHQPLVGAHIVLDNGVGTLTDENGRFRIDLSEGGERWVEISFIGYQKKREVTQLSENEPARIDFFLAPGEVMLNDVVVSGGDRHPVNVLTGLDINLRPVTTSQDVLRLIPGLFIAQHAGGGKAEQIFLRGFDIDHGTDLLLEVDGIPVNMVSHAHGQGYSDLHFLMPEIINHVDFDTGPYYAEKGDFNTAGYVSFATKAMLEENFIKAEAGSFGTMRYTAGVNFGDGDASGGYVAGEFFHTNGYVEAPQDFGRINLISKYTIRKRYDDLTVQASYFNSQWDASGQIPVRAVESGLISRFGAIDDSEGGETGRSQASIRHQHYFPAGGVLEQQAYLVHYDFNLFSNFTFFLNDPVLGDQIQQMESRTIFGYKVGYKETRKFLQRQLWSEIGGGVRYDQIKDIYLARAVKRTLLEYRQYGNINQSNAHVYFNEKINLSDRWTASAGVRIDFFSFEYNDERAGTRGREFQAVSSPKVSVHYAPSFNTEVYLKSGIGFHSNDTRVVVAQSGEDILPKAYGIDIGGNFRIHEKLLLHAALWRLDLDQEFVYVGDEGVVEPGGRTQRHGIDLSVRYQIFPSLFLDADLNLTEPKSKDDPEGANHVPLAPIFSSVGGLTYKTLKGFSGSLRFRYLADRPANEDHSVVAEGYTLADLVVRYSARRYEFGLAVENLFDSHWNEAQFNTESRLPFEPEAVSEIHFTPGTPFFVKLTATFFW